ncbi:MAG: hypothetical protein APF81_13765 [Desulfosporosinus sp. BRH_c37]|nr:MAG: hypothetical protein APF81_13765 [Desulfosporosinus sp. BRH_c37]
MHSGNVVQIPTDAVYWHGVAKDSWFVHLAIEVSPEKGPSESLEPVSDEDYNKLKYDGGDRYG